MSEVADALAWAERAEEDFVVARLSLQHTKPLTYSACFHAQQCAEKYLKAVLISHKQTFPKTHDLHLLSNLCSQAGILLEIDSDLLDKLSSHAIQTRYPGDDPTIEDAREALEIAQTVRRFARKFLGLR